MYTEATHKISVPYVKALCWNNLLVPVSGFTGNPNLLITVSLSIAAYSSKVTSCLMPAVKTKTLLSLKLTSIKQFWRRSRKCEMLTDNDRRTVGYDHSSLEPSAQVS